MLVSLALGSAIAIPQSGRADRQGDALLQRAVSSTAKLKSIEFEVQVRTKDGRKDVTRNIVISLKRPNLAHVFSSGNGSSPNTTLFSDGKQLTTFYREDKEFLRSPVDMNGGNIFSTGPVEAAVFFNPDLLNRLPMMGTGIKRTGSQLVGGVHCDVLKVIGAAKGSSFTIYMGPDGLLRGSTTITSNMVQESRVKRLRSNAVLSKSVFAWNPPAGAKPYQQKSAEVTLPTRLPEDDNGLLKVGAKAPDMLVNTLDGSKIQLSSLYKQNIATLVNFWFVGCPPCREELPELNTMYMKLKSKGFTMLAVNVQDEKPEIEKFWKKNKYSIPAVVNGQSIAERYQITATPTSYVVGRNGNILAAIFGMDVQGIRTAVDHAGIK